jgi:large subunit ribosomal protein L21
MATAIFRRGSRQYRVQEGEKLVVDYQGARGAGETIEFDQVLQLSNGEDVRIGRPTLPGVRVVAKVLEHVRDDKVISYRYRKRKDSHKKRGHRQRYTLVEITQIAVS